MTSFLDAAYHILKDAGHPLSSDEIVQKALDRHLLITSGLTPERTMSAQLYMDMKKKGNASRFALLGPNRFVLNEHLASQLTLINTNVPAEKTHLSRNASRTKTIIGNIPSAHKQLDQEFSMMRSFLIGKSERPPTSEKICDWVVLCYTLGLFSEGAELFGYVDPRELNEWYYERTKKMARLCSLHGSKKP